ncbi:NAD+ synthase [uncultured Methanosphaera sp.]|uniref:NAD+ synthase n=1 Tax=uncultured Methanosphaera sp. TaxID=262501 RepID=UPI000DC338DA|nr:NAD+ synthase [uncultured Methanosphaera sp.]RAP43476.1 MAG: NAD(+) synthetase [Methanosphaera sp. SHI1033]
MIDLPDFDAKEFIMRACTFIKNKVEESNSDGVVVGLSGGIDSTVVAALAVKALGSSHVRGYILPSLTTSDQDLFDAKLIKEGLDIETEYISIADVYDQFLKTCENDDLPQKNKSLASANLKPRIRMTLLYYYASIYNSLVIGTGNKTELQIGYFTKYGDGGVDLLPIGDLYKEDVRKVAIELGVPDSIINKAPTAGLWPGQTDESELGMTYPILDRVLYLYLEKNYDLDYIADILEIPSSEVERIVNMVHNAEHKRQMAPICNKFEFNDDEDDEEFNVYVDDY